MYKSVILEHYRTDQWSGPLQSEDYCLITNTSEMSTTKYVFSCIDVQSHLFGI